MINNKLKEKILIVDDCFELTEWLKYDLETNGFKNIFVAQSGFETLKFIEKNLDTNLIILDVMMPGNYKFIDLFQNDFSKFLESANVYLNSLDFIKNQEQFGFIETVIENTDLKELFNINENNQLIKSVKEIYETIKNNNDYILDKYGELFIHLDGFTVCSLLKSHDKFKHIEIILFTAGGISTDEEREELAKELGSDKYILKCNYYEILLPYLFKKYQSKQKINCS